MKISNISTFVEFNIDPLVKECYLKIHTRLRPGSIEYTLKNIDLESFNIVEELSMLKLTIDSFWNGTVTEEECSKLSFYKSASN